MHEIPLDERAAKFIGDRLAQIDAMQHSLNGALALIIEQHGCSGPWQLDWPNRRLVRTDEPQQQLKVA